ncbi:MAG: MarR family winged helix-turn-helix transcriptional regulator [Bryobacteraceae bacterium]|nr:MarR family winged helix-turn-helix transcriptional regulator [Bryobacteraceae bacterium]
MTRTERLEREAGPLSERLAHALSRISLALRHQAQRGAAARGLTPTQGEILVWLSRHGPSTLGEVARGLAITPATASDAVEALAAKKLLRKQRGRPDARSLRLTLTARGQREAARAATWPGFLAEAAALLPEAEQRLLLAVLIRIVKSLQDRGQIPPARMCVTCTYFRPFAHAGTARPHHCDLVDAPFGEAYLRVDCPEHQPAPEGLAADNWEAWLARSSFPE